MAVAVEQDTFESVGFVKGISEGKFPQSFVAELSNGDKLYGSKVKKDQTPTKVWPLIKESFDHEKYFKWTGNLKPGQHNPIKQVTFGFEVDEGPGPQPNWSGPADESHAAADEPTPDRHEFAPRTSNSGAPERITTQDLPPELAKPLEGAHKASQAMQNKGDGRNASFALSYAKDFVLGLVVAGEWDANEAEARVLATADTFKEWLDQQQQPQ